MKFIKLIFINLLIVVLFLSEVVFAETAPNSENFLIGMSVTQTFAGNYNIRLKFKNETDKKFTLKNLGNGSYSLLLPQVKKAIEENNIFYENDCANDIKVVISEKDDLTDANKYYTQVNFKTANDKLIHVEAFANKSASKPYIQINTEQNTVQTTETKKSTAEQTEKSSDWIWYIFVLILLVFSIILMSKAEDDSFLQLKKLRKDKQDKKESNKNIPDEKTEVKTLEKTDNIVDELVKVIIPENDLVLMPGVPELPGLENTNNKKSNIILKNVQINLYDIKNFKDNLHTKNPIIPEKMSLLERLKNKELIKEADDIIFSEKEEFFEQISPIKDIPEKIEEKEEENLPIGENPEETTEESGLTENQQKYEDLLSAFKKILFVAHKIQDDEDYNPEIIDAFGVSDNVGFSLVKMGNKTSLVGNIDNTVFVLKTLSADEVGEEPLYMEYCTQTPYSATYSVMLKNFKALVKITESDISLIGEYE